MSVLAMETISERQNLRGAEEFDAKFAEKKKDPILDRRRSHYFGIFVKKYVLYRLLCLSLL